MESKLVLVTGGAGSLGRRLVRHFLDCGSKTRVLDVNENGLAKLKLTLPDTSNARFFVGDIRDKARVVRAMENVDVVVHTAALKHVDLCEYNPFECLQTNIIGTQNCIDAALECNVGKFLLVSSDKAVNPIGVYGYSKAFAEALTLDAENYRGSKQTRFAVVRCPNFLGSDGSVLTVWKWQKQHHLPLTLTDPNMERYFIQFRDLLQFMDYCIVQMKGGEVFVPDKIFKKPMKELAETVSNKIHVTEARCPEKIVEELMSKTEKEHAVLNGDVWIIKQNLDGDNIT